MKHKVVYHRWVHGEVETLNIWVYLRQEKGHMRLVDHFVFIDGEKTE